MMMKELSLHVLDIMQNSIVAGATFIEIEVEIQSKKDWMRISIRDNGCGMDDERIKKVVDPFTTSRTTRKVGLGIPMFKAGAQAAGGKFLLESTVNKGTLIQAEYQISHLDRPPLGDMVETLYAQIICNDKIDFLFSYTVNAQNYTFDTRTIRSALGEEIPFNIPDVAKWIKEELTEGFNALNGGV